MFHVPNELQSLRVVLEAREVGGEHLRSTFWIEVDNYMVDSSVRSGSI